MAGSERKEKVTGTGAGGRCLLMLMAFVLLLALCGCSGQKGPPGQPPVVEVVQVVQKDVPVTAEWVGTTDGLVNAIIRAQVQGYLIKQNYYEGDFVRKGQVLFEIDPRTFQAAVDQAKAEVAQAQARWQTASANLARVRPLAQQNAVSQRDLDDAVGSELSTRASVLAAKASLDKAELNLAFTKVTSLIDGIAGIAKAQIGDLVGPGAADELTTVSTVDPIKVYINISEHEYMEAVRARERGKAAEAVVLELTLSDGTVYPHKGRFAIADRQVDVKTGTLKIAALFKNPGNVLRPGQFGKVRAVVRTRTGALLVPQRAITELQGSYQVAVVGQDNKIDIRPVKVGERVDALWVIEEGLNPGERVVAEGVQKVRQGMPVNAKPFEPPQKPGAGPPAKADAQPAKPAEAKTR